MPVSGDSLGVTVSKFYDWRDRYGCVNEHNGWVARDFWLEPWRKEAIIRVPSQESAGRLSAAALHGLDIWAQSGAYFIPRRPIPRYRQYQRPIDSPQQLGSNRSIAADSVGRATLKKWAWPHSSPVRGEHPGADQNVRSHPGITKDVPARGFIFDVDTGFLREVLPIAQRADARCVSLVRRSVG